MSHMVLTFCRSHYFDHMADIVSVDSRLSYIPPEKVSFPSFRQTWQVADSINPFPGHGLPRLLIKNLEVLDSSVLEWFSPLWKSNSYSAFTDELQIL